MDSLPPTFEKMSKLNHVTAKFITVASIWVTDAVYLKVVNQVFKKGSRIKYRLENRQISKIHEAIIEGQDGNRLFLSKSG